MRLLIAMGYGGSFTDLDQALVGKSGDGVIDHDPLGLDRIYVQANRYGADKTVGSEAMRGFIGSLNIAKATKGLFVTTSSFTASARQTAERGSTGFEPVSSFCVHHPGFPIPQRW